MAGIGRAWFGLAGQGRRDAARQGPARQGKAGGVGLGEAWQG